MYHLYTENLQSSMQWITIGKNITTTIIRCSSNFNRTVYNNWWTQLFTILKLICCKCCFPKYCPVCHIVNRCSLMYIYMYINYTWVYIQNIGQILYSTSLRGKRFLFFINYNKIALNFCAFQRYWKTKFLLRGILFRALLCDNSSLQDTDPSIKHS